MAKAASPVRLDKDLMSTAALAGKVFHRSATEQVEHWATLGRIIAHQIDSNTLVSLMAGTARLKVEMVRAPRVDPDAVQGRIDQLRESGTLPQRVTGAPLKYQASRAYPGFLERIDGKSGITVGQFRNGVFLPRNDMENVD